MQSAKCAFCDGAGGAAAAVGIGDSRSLISCCNGHVRIEDLFLGNTTDTSSVDFFDNAFTFSNHSSNVTCCHPDNTFEVATCGQGASCAGQCSALGASLCPAGECSDDPRTCELDFNNDNAESQQQRGRSTATYSGSDLKWCISKGCKVRKHKGSHQLK